MSLSVFNFPESATLIIFALLAAYSFIQARELRRGRKQFDELADNFTSLENRHRELLKEMRILKNKMGYSHD